MDIGKIVLKAAFIEERRKNPDFSTTPSAQAEVRLIEWENLLNKPDNNTIFSKRLQHDGISKEGALRICGECSFAANKKLPRWAELITEILKRLPVTSAEAESGSSMKRKEIDLPGPVLSLFPFVMYCERRLKQNYDGLPMEDLSRMVLNRLYQAAYQVFNTKAQFLMLEGHKLGEGLWERMESHLLSGGWQEYFAEYPVLARRMGTVIEHYLDFIEEFLERFYKNKEILEKEFFLSNQIKQLLKVEGEISDLHQNGRSVLILTFDGKRKLVYKPRSLEIDVCWEKFTEGFPFMANSKAPHAVDFGEYGFVEFIEQKPCDSLEEIKTYFYHAGALMALLYALGGNDFHRENIIAEGIHPAIIDIETLMIPVVKPFEQKEPGISERTDPSVRNLGMLPLPGDKDKTGKEDWSALTGSAEGCNNLPVWNGRKYSAAQFPEKVAEGFRDRYRQILENREEILGGEKGIGLFSDCKFRMMIRTTQAYTNVIKNISRSGNLKDGFKYSSQTERIGKAFFSTSNEEILPGLLRVFQSEKNALQNGCIPIFYGEPGGKGILDEKELLFKEYFEKSAQENAADAIRSMDENDLAIQLQIIDKSLMEVS